MEDFVLMKLIVIIAFVHLDLKVLIVKQVSVHIILMWTLTCIFLSLLFSLHLSSFNIFLPSLTQNIRLTFYFIDISREATIC